MADGSLKFDTSIDDSGFNKGAKKVEQSAKKTAKKVGSSAKDAGKDAEKAADEAAGKTEKAAGKAEQKVKKSAEASKSSAKEAGKSIGSDAEQAGEKIRKSSEKTSKGIKEQSEKTLEGVGKSIGATVDAVETLSQALVAAGVAASVKEITDALLDCTQASRDFEAGMAKVGTIADASQKPLEDMRDEILQLSGNTGKSVGELSEATYQAISASVATKDAVDFVGTANKLAVGGFADTTTAVDILTTAINAYGMSADDASRISDVLITTQNLGKTSVAELGSSMGKVIPLAAAYNMKLEDLAAGYAMMTANGIQTAETTTYIRAALNELGSASTVVGKTLKQQTGKSFSQLMKEGKSLGDVVQILADSVDGDVTAFSNLWSSSEAGIGMLSVLNGSTAKYNSLLKSMEDSTGAASTAFGKMAETGEFAQQRFQNATENLKIAIGDVLAPTLSELQGNAADAMQWATDFVEQHPQVVAAVSALTAALGVLAAALAGLTAAKAAAAAITALNAALAANPAGMVAIALASLTAAVATFGAVLKDRTSEAAENEKAVKKCRKSYEELQKAVEESTAKSEENKTSLESEYGACKVLSDKLYDLADKEHKTAGEEAEMAVIVDELNSKIPGLNLSIDETTGALSRQRSETDSLIESMKNQALASAAQEDMAKAAKNLYEAEKQRNEALEVYNDLRKQAKAAEEEYQRALEDTGTTASEAYNIYEAKMSSLNKQMKEQKEILKEQRERYGEIRRQFQSASNAAAGYMEAAGSITEANWQNAQSWEDAAGSAGIQESALESLKQKYDGFRGQLEQDIQNKVSLFDTFDGGKDMSVETMLENLRKQKEGLENWKVNMETLAEEVGTTITPEFYNAILEMGPQAANAVQHMVTTLEQSNGKELLAQLAQEWGYNLDFSGPASDSLANTEKMVESGLTGVLNIARSAGVSIPEDLANGITSGTMDLNTAADCLGNELSKGMGQLTQMAEEAGVQVPAEITTGLENGGQAAVDAAQRLINLIAGQNGEMVETGNENGEALNQGTKDGIENSSSEVVDAASDVGTEAGTQMQESESSAIEQNSGKVTSAVDGTMQKAEDAALGYYNGFYNVGANLMRGTVAGMTAESPAVERVAREAVRKAIAGAKNEGDVRSPSHVMRDEVGKMLATGMAEGILDGTEEVEKSAREMARASVDVTKDELEIRSPSDVFRKKIGKNIVKGVIKGIQDDQKLLNKEMKSMCRQAVEAAKSVDAKTGNYSDVGSAIIESITAGLDSRKELTGRKLEKKINGYVDKAVGTLEKKADNAKSKKKKKKYQEDAEALKEFADEYVASFLNALNAGIDAEYDRIQAKLDDKLTEISDRYQELYDTITSKQAGMMGKMSIPSNLYDLDTQLEQIERYQNGLSRLNGKIPDTLMDEILGMDVNEADNFVEYLNSLTDSELAAYKEKWGSLQSQSKSFSESFFSSQLGSLKSEYQKRSRTPLKMRRRR